MSAAAHKRHHLIKGTLTRNRLPLLIHALLVGLLMSVPGSNLRGEGIADANIIIEGTHSGAATDADGYYVILTVAPGIYDVRATVTGYPIEPRGSVRGVNTLQEFLTRPDFYSEPRRVIIGVSLGFNNARDRTQ